MVQTRQGFRSTKKLLLKNPEITAAIPAEQHPYKTTKKLGSPPNEIYIREIHRGKFYTDDIGRFIV